MPAVLNLRFTADAPEDAEFEHPAGAALMRDLSAGLSAAGWSTDEMGNWRDCGWSVVCRRDTQELEVVLSWVQRGYWLLQIRPHHEPGFLRRWLGSVPSASSDAVHKLALAVHRALLASQVLGDPRWRWDNFPDDASSAPEPPPA